MNITGALAYLTQLFFSAYITIVLLRVILQYVRAPFSNPICQFIVKITNFGFKPLRKFIPGFKGIDFAGIVFAYLISLLSLTILFIISFGRFPSISFLLIPAIFDLIDSGLSILFWSIIIRIVFSFIQATGSGAFNPLSYLVFLITEPVLSKARRLVPPLGGLDLSPMLPLIGISLIRILFNIG